MPNKPTSDFLANKRKVATLFINTVKKGAHAGKEIASINFHDAKLKQKIGAEKELLYFFDEYDEDKKYALKFLNPETNRALFVVKKNDKGHPTSYSLRYVTDKENKENNKYLLCSQFPKTQYPNAYDVFETVEE